MPLSSALLLDDGLPLAHPDDCASRRNHVTTADLDGFTHADLATIAAVLLYAGEIAVPARLRRESRVGSATLEAAGTILALADDIDRRLPPSRGAVVGELGRDGRLDIGGMPPMLLPSSLSERCRAVLHRDLREVSDLSHPRARGTRPEVAVEFK